MSNDSKDVAEVSDQQVSNKVALTISRIKKFIKFATRFSKQHKLALAITAAIIIALTAVFNAMPTVGVGNLKMANLNTTVRLEAEQTAKLKYDDVAVSIINFINAPCPEGQKCFGETGVFAEYRVSVNGKEYKANSMDDKTIGGYTLHTVSSDYKTYAEVELTKLK
ncbi:MAG: hypothetical protein WA087_02480 [Candidatus Saccharimonadales bacterium]